tara:strand:+ start:763 stop:1002 length:240 start_codon:yes stop_codon:yes gene_type:complete
MKRKVTIYREINSFGERGAIYSFSTRGKYRLVELFFGQVILVKPTFPHTKEKLTKENAEFIFDDSVNPEYIERFKKEIL